MSATPPRAGHRVARWLGGAGVFWGIVASGYLIVTEVGKHTVSVLHNASAREDELLFAALALVLFVAAGAPLAVGARPGWVRGLLVAAGGVVAGTVAAEAVALSSQPDVLVGLALLAVPPAALLVAAGAAATAADDRPRGAISVVAVAVAVAVLLDGVLVDEPYDEALVFAGLRGNWRVERAVGNVMVDDAGTVWGVHPWHAAAEATLSRRDPETGAFVEVTGHAAGWPPTVVGADVHGTTWFVRSDAADPFLPVVETVRDDDVGFVPHPDERLPAFDGVALDRARARFYAAHGDFRAPVSVVLEVYDARRGWRSVETPVTAPDRTHLLDLAVDEAGDVWLWQAREPARAHRYDGERWESVDLGFDAEARTDLGFLSIGIDPFDVFLPGPDGRLWLWDARADLLVRTTGGPGPRAVPLPAGCVPRAVDEHRRVWCGSDDGLVVIEPDGTVRYDSRAAGLHRFRVVSAAVGAGHAWLLVRRGDAEVLLRFHHAAAIPAGAVAWSKRPLPRT